MYTSFFGLHEKPFSITPDPRYLFMSERHREALAHLLPMQRSEAKLKILLTVSQILSSPEPVDAVLPRIVDLLLQILDVHRAALGRLGDHELADHRDALAGGLVAVGLPGVEPALGCTALALRAMPVAARVVGDIEVLAAIAAQHVSAER